MREAVAALDLGTSRLRLGVVEAAGSVALLAEVPAPLTRSSGGIATTSASAVLRAVDEVLLPALDAWCVSRGVTTVQLGLCGQVSSLLRWDDVAGVPADDAVAVWLDSRCAAVVPEVAAFLAGGRDLALLGTRLPPAANWLLTKLRHDRDSGAGGLRSDSIRILQLADAVFAHLTGRCLSHPSAQISLIHQDTGTWATEALTFAGISRARLPQLDPTGYAPVRRPDGPAIIVHVGLQDTVAALAGLAPQDGDGVLIAGTSEILGACRAAPAAPSPVLVRGRCGSLTVDYGSSRSGGDSVRWLMSGMLRGTLALDALTAEAEDIADDDTPVFLPYLAGERAPLWDDALTGAFVGLRAHHGAAHLLRAVLAGVACARRQTALALPGPAPRQWRAAGGSLANPLWNRLRASLLGAPLIPALVREAALVGACAHAATVAGLPAPRVASGPAIAPDPTIDAAGLYARFRAAQRAWGIGRGEAAHGDGEAILGDSEAPLGESKAAQGDSEAAHV